MKQLALVLAVPLLLVGCTPELLSFLRPDDGGKFGDENCTIALERPAPMFYVSAPATTSAGVTVTLEPWVLLSAPVLKIDEIRPQTFVAEVDHPTKRVTIRGSITRHEANPEADCAFPAMYMMPKAATLSVPLSLPAGTWEVAIATDSFTTEKPPYHPAEPNATYPGPQATRSLVVE
jgi:hypothetical protein